jgi:hypothetical protein
MSASAYENGLTMGQRLGERGSVQMLVPTRMGSPWVSAWEKGDQCKCQYLGKGAQCKCQYLGERSSMQVPVPGRKRKSISASV